MTPSAAAPQQLPGAPADGTPRGEALRPVLWGAVAPGCPWLRPVAMSQGPLSPAGGGAGGSRSALRSSFFFKGLQLLEPLQGLPSGLGFWKSAQWLCGGLHPLDSAESAAEIVGLGGRH